VLVVVLVVGCGLLGSLGALVKLCFEIVYCCPALLWIQKSTVTRGRPNPHHIHIKTPTHIHPKTPPPQTQNTPPHTHHTKHTRTTPDKLFRVNDVTKRRKYAALVEGVEAAGGEALVFSSMHVSGACAAAGAGGWGFRAGVGAGGRMTGVLRCM